MEVRVTLTTPEPCAAVVFAGSDELPRLSDCPRSRPHGGLTCADCFLEATLGAFAPVRGSFSCERRRYMHLALVGCMRDSPLVGDDAADFVGEPV
jgi:hypothetical protein